METFRIGGMGLFITISSEVSPHRHRDTAEFYRDAQDTQDND
jgi:hypothetical protein